MSKPKKFLQKTFLVSLLTCAQLVLPLSNSALAQAGPVINSMTFANRTGVVTNGNVVSLDLSGVTASDLASSGSIDVSTSSTLMITQPPLGLAVGLLAGLNNNINTATLFGYNILPSELKATAIASGGVIPVQGTLTDIDGNVTNFTINITVDITPPVINTLSFAGRTGTVGSSSVDIDLTGVTDADLAGPGTINVNETSTFAVVSAPLTTPTPVSLNPGDNTFRTQDIFGFNILASELAATAIQNNGLIPVTVTLADTNANTSTYALNIHYTQPSGGGGGGGGPIISPTVTAINVPLALLPTQSGSLRYTFSDNTSVLVQVPQGAINSATTFDVAEVAPDNSILPSTSNNTFLIGGRTYKITAVTNQGQITTNFSQNLTISIKLPLPSDSQNIGVYFFDPANQRWVLIPNFTVDEANSQVIFNVSHLTLFGVFHVPGLSSILNIPAVAGVKLFANGSLIKAPNNRIYLVIGNELVRILNLTELKKFRGIKINKVSDEVISAFQIIPGRAFAVGELIRSSDKRIYVIQTNGKHYIRSLQELRKYAGKRINNVDINTLNFYPTI